METITINNETLEFNVIIYVDANNGNDDTGDGSENAPYKTLQKALDNITENNNEAIYLQNGLYPITSIHNIFDIEGYSLIGQNGDTEIEIEHGYTGGWWDRPIHLDVYNLVITLNENFVANSDREFLFCSVNVADFDFGFHNVVYDNKGLVTGSEASEWLFYFSTTINSVNFVRAEFDNCSFLTHGITYPLGYGNNDLLGDIVYTNFATDNDIISGSSYIEKITCLTNATFDVDYNITSSGWQNTGTGENPDGSQAHIGVYGGPYAWGIVRSVTSHINTIISEAEKPAIIKIATSSVGRIESGAGFAETREVNSYVSPVNTNCPEIEYAKQVRSHVSKIDTQATNPRLREVASYIGKINSQAIRIQKQILIVNSTVSLLESYSIRTGKGTRTKNSIVNTINSSAKYHYDRTTSSIMKIVSSAEIGPVTKGVTSYININSNIAKLAKVFVEPTFFKKIITDVISSSVTPKGLERLPDNYNKKPDSNNWKLLTIIQDEISQIKQAAEKISKVQDIDEASGEFLDRHGENLQLKRGNKPDPIYRIALKAKLQRNLSRGSVNEIIEIIATMLDIDVKQVEIEENPGGEPASVYIGVPLAPLAKFGLSYERFADIVDGILAAGVSLYSLTQGTYTYGDTDYEYNEAQGLADATDPDRIIGGYFGAWAERGI